jgi:hypothetical protein
MASPDGRPPPVSNPITGTWRNSFADKDQKGRALQKLDRVEELVCDLGIFWAQQRFPQIYRVYFFMRPNWALLQAVRSAISPAI